MTSSSNSSDSISSIYYRKYLSFGYALDTLRNGFFLADPQTWEDRNDRICAQRYENLKNVRLRATCLTCGTEKYHHWKSYDQKEQLASILFHKRFLDENWKTHKPEFKFLRFRKVIYRSPIGKRPLTCASLPFYKTHAYRSEQECRFVAAFIDAPCSPRLKFPSEAVAKIVINPWCHNTVVDALKKAVNSICGYENTPVNRSEVLEREEWADRVATVRSLKR